MVLFHTNIKTIGNLKGTYFGDKGDKKGNCKVFGGLKEKKTKEIK